MRGLLLASLAVAAILAIPGCLDNVGQGSGAPRAKVGAGGAGSGAIAIPEGWAEAVFADENDHDHRKFALHQGLSTANFEVVGYDPLNTDYHGKSAGGYFCGAVREKDGRRLSVVHSWVSDVAFVISDVSNPRNPQKIGEFVMANTHVYDLALTPDQNWLLLSTSPGTNNIGNDPGGDAAAAPAAVFRDACTGEERPVMGPEQGLPFASGIVLVDIRNPRVPAIVDFRFIPVTGGHSVQVESQNGKDLILVTVTSGMPVVGNPTGQYLHAGWVFMEFLDTPAGRKMNILSRYQFPAQPSPVPGVQVPSSTHDGFLRKHPVTGEWLAFLAAGNSGIAILNVDDPRMPRLVGSWNDWKVFGEAAPSIPFVHHTLPLPDAWDGRHYTFMGEECGGRRPKSPTCLVVMLDTTDPKAPSFVGGWTLPIDVQWSAGALYSTHYLAVQNRTLFTSLYHGGVWAIDLSTPEAMRTMPSIGVFMPDRAPAKGTVYPNHVYHFTPVVLDVLPTSDGHLIVYDGTSGLYVVRFDASRPAPSPPPWPFPFNQ